VNKESNDSVVSIIGFKMPQLHVCRKDLQFPIYPAVARRRAHNSRAPNITPARQRRGAPPGPRLNVERVFRQASTLIGGFGRPSKSLRPSTDITPSVS